jgi:hypothetical protein
MSQNSDAVAACAGCLGSRDRFVTCVAATDVVARAGNWALNNRIGDGLGGAA